MKNLKTAVAVIGAGTAGLGAYRAARAAGKSTLMIEGGPYGTTCARVGCMPSKLLIAAAEAAHHHQIAPGFGLKVGDLEVDGSAVMHRVKSERDRFVGFVLESVESISDVDRIRGYARFEDDHHLVVDEKIRIEADSVVIASGSSPFVPPMYSDLGDALCINDDVFEWDDLPKSVAVIGPGVIGLELGQALHRLGVRVRIFGRGGGLGGLSDPEVVEIASEVFEKEFPLNRCARIEKIVKTSNGVSIHYAPAPNETLLEENFEKVLVATGRRPNLKNLALENTSLKLDDKGRPEFNPFTAQIEDSHIFLAGDVSQFRPLLHEASDEGRIAGRNAANYPDVTPGERRSALGVVFCDPQIAMVGDSFKSLEEGSFALGRVSFANQGRSRVMLQNRGVLHLYGDLDTKRFLGAEMVGPRAEHIAHLLAWSHQQKLTVEQMLAMPFYHPVIEEGLRTALRDLNQQVQEGVSYPKGSIDCGAGA